MISPELREKIRRIELRTFRLASESLSGAYTSAYRGSGLTFEEVRQYEPGDDVRFIDWKVTARVNVPHVKLFREERQLRLMLAVDVSRSMFLGKGQSKFDRALELAAALAFLTQQNRDKVGVFLFSDRSECFVPPVASTAQKYHIIREMLEAKPSSAQTDIGFATQFLSQHLPRHSVVFLLSDFVGPGFAEGRLMQMVRRLRQKFSFSAVRLIDEFERALPPAGICDVEDLESGKRLLVNFSDPRLRRHWAALQQEKSQRLRKLMGQQQVPFLELAPKDDLGKALQRFFEQQNRRKH